MSPLGGGFDDCNTIIFEELFVRSCQQCYKSDPIKIFSKCMQICFKISQKLFDLNAGNVFVFCRFAFSAASGQDGHHHQDSCQQKETEICGRRIQS